MRIISVLAFGLVSGCFPVEIYHKTGVSLTRLHADETACQVKALKNVPVNKLTRVTPVRFIPRQICDGNGNCHATFVMVGGEVETYDANKDLRARYAQQCMTDKGYSKIELPRCTGEAPEPLPRHAPALSDESCAVRTKTGFQAVTPS